MATGTLGTNANNTLTSLKFLPGFNSGMAAADIATIAQSIKDDLGNLHPIAPGAFTAEGQLFIPNRGWLKMLPGDYVAVDATGWPILVSARAAAGASYTHT